MLLDFKSVDDLKFLRNIGIIAHIDAGKTTTSERILFYSGRIHKLGEVHYGNTELDWMPQEQERGITITAATTTFLWNNHQINLIDTPGHVDFTVEVERSLRVLDGAVVIFDGVNGVEAQTETVWKQADRLGVARIGFVNKMDKVGASFQQTLESIKNRLRITPVPLVWPVGSESDFTGIIDLITLEKWIWPAQTDGTDYTIVPLEADHLDDEINQARQNLLESLAEYDDQMLDCYLQGIFPQSEQLKSTIRRLCHQNKVFPVLCGSAFKNKGIQPLLNAIVDYLPNPLERGEITGKPVIVGRQKDEIVKIPVSFEHPVVALLFKIVSDPFAGSLSYLRIYSGTLKAGDALLNSRLQKRERIQKLFKMHANSRTEVNVAKAGDIVAVVGPKVSGTGDTLCDPSFPVALESILLPEPVISVVVEPKTSQDAQKLREALERLVREDPSARLREDPETGQLLLSGMGELHLEILLDRLHREFQVPHVKGTPQVSYREGFKGKAQVRECFERLLGQVFHGCCIEIAIHSHEESINSPNEIKVAEHILQDKNLRALADLAVQGVRESLDAGPLSGFPILGARINIVRIEPLENRELSELAVKAAANAATRQAFQQLNFILLEPVFKVEIITEEAYIGAVMSDLNGRRAHVDALNPDERRGTIITARVPLAELFGYPTRLRSLTQGRASLSMEFLEYRPLDTRSQQDILRRLGRL